MPHRGARRLADSLFTTARRPLLARPADIGTQIALIRRNVGWPAKWPALRVFPVSHLASWPATLALSAAIRFDRAWERGRHLLPPPSKNA